jgi:hypothetical protein
MPHEEKRSGCQDTQTGGKQGAFAMDCVDGRSRGGLHGNRYEPTEGKNIADATRIPSARSKIGRQEGSEAGLDIGEKKIQPFDCPKTPLFSRRGIAHSISSSVA